MDNSSYQGRKIQEFEKKTSTCKSSSNSKYFASNKITKNILDKSIKKLFKKTFPLAVI